MAFIEPMHRNKPNITYLLTGSLHRQGISIPGIDLVLNEYSSHSNRT